MKRFFAFASAMLIMLTVCACSRRRVNENTAPSTYIMGTTAPQSTIHEFQDIKFPDSWTDDGNGTVSGSEWPDNRLSNILPKPNFGKSQHYSASFLADYATFTITVEGATVEDAKKYKSQLKGFSASDEDVDDENEYLSQGSYSKMNIYIQFNKSANRFTVSISRKYSAK